MHPSSRLMRYGVCRQLLTPRAWPCHHSSSTLSPTSCLATVELTGAWRFPHRTFCSRTQPNLANPPSPPYTHANALGANADGASFPFSFNGAPHRNTADADDAQGHTTAESIFAATFPNSHAYTHMYAASSAEGDAHHQERSTNASDTRQMGGAWAGLRSATAAMAAAGAAASAREPGKTGAQQQHEMDAQEEQAQLNRLSPQQREELAAYRKTHAEWVDKNKQLIDDRHEAFQIKQAAEELRKSGSHTASQEVSQSMRFFLFGVIPFMILVGLVRYADTIFFMEDLKSINVVDYNKAIKEEEREKKR